MEFNDRIETGTGQETEVSQVKECADEDASLKQAVLERWAQALTEKEEKLNRQEQELSDRENSLRRQSALADEKDAALRERECQIGSRELDVSKCEIALSKQKAELDRQQSQAMVQLEKEQLKAKEAFENNLAQERAKTMARMQEQLEAHRKEFEDSLVAREQTWQDSVQKRLDKRIKEAEDEADNILNKARECAEQKIEFLTKEACEKDTLVNEKLQKLDERAKELDRRESDLQSREDELDGQRRKIEREKNRQERKNEELDAREADLETTIKESIQDRIKAFDRQMEDKERELEEVRERCRQRDKERESIESFKVSIGETPEIIRDRQNRMQSEIDSLKQELATRAPKSLEADFKNIQEENRQLKVDYEESLKKVRILEQEKGELSHFETKNISLLSENQELKSVVEELRAQAEQYRKRIERLSVSEAKLSDYEARIAEIRKGFLPPLIGANLPCETSEIRWLQTISEQCAIYGVAFPRRILYAFHTALKISDWSSITVLAGVSGTGKSELPKLYAAFGGLNFIAVPVQPNWDSQESMLGFFNSIDNCFEPEDLLRFLVQCTEDEQYNQYMSIVLLDEMNLAHVEHYFADFLSKLESRRGASKKELPSVEVKLGAGVPPYRLELVRTIMWTGTMNQDETTKSLSDKVLDRGLVINFPRPRTLRSRENMPVLQRQIKELNRPMLTKQAWNSWVVRKIELEGEQRDEIDRYRKIVERINDEFEHVGRALGHRVWQSIEYYMMNYPVVIAERAKLNPGEMSMGLKKAMKIAFEDQIVQKIMPKLRGVETRGHAQTNLDAIEELLEQEGFESLKDDFKIACEQGYGQFIWSSAKYIEADESENEGFVLDGRTEDVEADEQG